MIRQEARHGEPQVLAVLVVLLRALRGWSRTQLWQVSGIDKSQLSLYERGKVAPSQRTQERLAGAVGLPLHLLEPTKAFIRRLQEAMELPVPTDTLPAASMDLEPEWKLAACEALARVASQAHAEVRLKANLTAVSDAARAEALWERLKPFSAEERRVLIRGAREYQDPALGRLLRAESERAAMSEAGVARELAELAVLVEEQISGGPRRPTQ